MTYETYQPQWITSYTIQAQLRADSMRLTDEHGDLLRIYLDGNNPQLRWAGEEDKCIERLVRYAETSVLAALIIGWLCNGPGAWRGKVLKSEAAVLRSENQSLRELLARLTHEPGEAVTIKGLDGREEAWRMVKK